MPAAAASGEDWPKERSAAGEHNPWLIVGVISIATFMEVLDTSIANVSLNHIAGSLSSSYDEATWVLTSYLIANAIIIPISGWLADVLGRKRYYMMSVALFTVSSLLCGIAPNLTFLILARVLQGIGGGGLAPSEQSMIVDTFPAKKRGLAFSAYGLVVIVGPVVGPTLGGLITDNISWHWVFLINVPVGILSLVLVTLLVNEPEALKKERAAKLKAGVNFDWLGFLFIALFLGCLEVTLDRGQRDDWFSNPTITICAVLSAAGLIGMIAWELNRKDPVVDLRMFANRNFAVAAVLLWATGLILYGTTQFIPQMLQEVMGYTATWAGLALTAGGLATVVLMPVSGIASNKVDPRPLIGGAFLIQAIALVNMTHLNAGLAFKDAAFARLIQAIGLPFLFIPITTIAYVGLKPEQSNQASALMNVVRNLGGTMGISLTQTLVERREQVHQSRIVEGLNGLNPNYLQGLQILAQPVGPGPQATLAANAQLYQQITTQSQMLAYLDTFKILSWIIFALCPLVLLMRGKPAGEQGGGGGE